MPTYNIYTQATENMNVFYDILHNFIESNKTVCCVIDTQDNRIFQTEITENS